MIVHYVCKWVVRRLKLTATEVVMESAVQVVRRRKKRKRKRKKWRRGLETYCMTKWLIKRETTATEMANGVWYRTWVSMRSKITYELRPQAMLWMRLQLLGFCASVYGRDSSHPVHGGRGGFGVDPFRGYGEMLSWISVSRLRQKVSPACGWLGWMRR